MEKFKKVMNIVILVIGLLAGLAILVLAGIAMDNFIGWTGWIVLVFIYLLKKWGRTIWKNLNRK